MRALVLLLLCVVLLAVLQASYIVAEAKQHDGVRATDDARRMDGKQLTKEERKMRRRQRKGEAPDSDVEAAGDVEEQKLFEDDDADMTRDEPSSERGGRRERVSKEERRAAKSERKAAKTERQAAKTERQNSHKNKGGGGGGGGGGGKGAGQEERQAKKAERKAARQAKKAGKQAGGRASTRVACTSETDCGEGECCAPNRAGEMSCKANRKPRRANKKCVTSCTCEGDLECYQETPSEAASTTTTTGRRQRNLGKCVAPTAADLTRGSILTAASRVASAAAAAVPAVPAA